MAKFTFIDLFAGIGGFRLGLSKNGNDGECVGFSEIDKTAIATYCDNYEEPVSANLGDITKIKELPPHDLLTGGVPCQSWSIAGKNLGFDDDRGQLWNDTIYLLNQSRPKAFIFENVKGLSDPRNADALEYILQRVREAGYHAKPFVLDSSDYGIPQSRVRVYIVGFHSKAHLDRFVLPDRVSPKPKLFHFLDLPVVEQARTFTQGALNLFGEPEPVARPRFRRGKDLNDFFLFNDIRNGTATVHSWDIIGTTQREKDICMLLLTNRRKRAYGPFDGNPLSLEHFRSLDPSITRDDLEGLRAKGILKKVEYAYQIHPFEEGELSPQELLVLGHATGDRLMLDELKNSRSIKQAKFTFKKVLEGLKSRAVLSCTETRYEFKFSKISSGINGINRIYLPVSEVFSTLVASGTNDFVATVNVTADNHEEFKERFLHDVFQAEAFRRITKEEACAIQGFPRDFKLPERREKWMKLLGNSVSVPVINQLCKAMARTGVFDTPSRSLADVPESELAFA